MIIPRRGERHIEFDLNQADDPSSRPLVPPHDVVVMAEVIEHLWVHPAAVLKVAADWLDDEGILVLQTPNAAALHQRVKLLVGQNPYESIRSERTRPGHFHEYTLAQLDDLVRGTRLEVVHRSAENYFRMGGATGSTYRWLGPVMPARLRQGFTFVLRRPASG